MTLKRRAEFPKADGRSPTVGFFLGFFSIIEYYL